VPPPLSQGTPTMQADLETRIHPFLTTGETRLQIQQPNPQQYARSTVSYWLGAVTLAAIRTIIAISWLDTPDALLLFFAPPFLLLITIAVKQDQKKEAMHTVQASTDQRQFILKIDEGA